MPYQVTSSGCNDVISVGDIVDIERASQLVFYQDKTTKQVFTYRYYNYTPLSTDAEGTDIEIQLILDLSSSIIGQDCPMTLLYQPEYQLGYQGGRPKSKPPKPTKKHIMIQNKKHLIYEGSRGGQYVKQKGVFVSLKKYSEGKK